MLLTWTGRLAAIATVLACALGAGCARAPVPADAVLAPNANLHVEGIPPIPMTLVRQVEAYTDFRGHSLVDWHPTERRMLVAHRKAGDTLTQLYLLDGPLAVPRQLTDGADPVSQGLFEPRAGRFIVFERASAGNEAARIYRLDLDTRAVTLLTPTDERHDIVGWLRDGSRLIVRSVPLDRTAEGGRRSQVTTIFWLTDPLRPGSRQVIATLPGGGWGGGTVTPDDRTLALTQVRSAEESAVWLLDIASGQRRQVFPAAGDPARAAHGAGSFTPDGKALWVLSNRGGEFVEAMRLDLAGGTLQRLSGPVPWDVAGLAASDDGRHVAVRINADGRHELRLFDAATGAERALPVLPAGSVTQQRFHRLHGALAFAVASAQGPNQIHVLDPATGRVEAWTRAEAPPGVDTSRFRDQQLIRWPSFDGRTISGWLNLPPPRFGGPRPVLIEVHGGPESQATAGFLGRHHYFIQEMGIAVIQPNVRGSRGYGKTFLGLDNGRRREDSVRDIGALLDWIRTQPGLDASRVVVSGGSYGGYVSLATAVHYGDRIAGAIDSFGISHFVTFLETTESYRRDLRRVEYGDERDPAMREFLHRISPLTSAHRITRPLFVIQGRNDPRVPYTEAEQIVARARANGTPVWYLRAENEGHGFARKENADFRMVAMVRFLENVLLAPRGAPDKETLP